MSEPTTSPSYPVDSLNQVKRRHDRGFYDHETVHALLDAYEVAYRKPAS